MYKFLKGTFITIKPHCDTPRYQTLGWASDHLRKISDNFIVVREKNKINSNYHFHALVLKKKEPHKGWFKKGVHIHQCEVGDINKKGFNKSPVYPETEEELDMMNEGRDLIDIELIKYNRSQIQKRKSKKQNGHIDRLIGYMTKEATLMDACVYVNGKRQLRPGIPALIPGHEGALKAQG